MTDTVIKGSGNSRSLKTVPNALTLYPTHEAMVAAMVDGTFPIDLGPLNDAGVQTRGMDLTKANLLSDATAALYGKGDNASPDDVLAAIYSEIYGSDGLAPCARIETGSYIGSGTYGVNNPNSLTLSFEPKILIISGTLTLTSVQGQTKNGINSGAYDVQITWTGEKVEWYGTSAHKQMNDSGSTYLYVAIG